MKYNKAQRKVIGFLLTAIFSAVMSMTLIIANSLGTPVPTWIIVGFFMLAVVMSAVAFSTEVN